MREKYDAAEQQYLVSPSPRPLPERLARNVCSWPSHWPRPSRTTGKSQVSPFHARPCGSTGDQFDWTASETRRKVSTPKI